MATTLLLWSSSNEKEQENPKNTPNNAGDLKPEISKPRTKRGSKPNAASAMPKRPPQRGLGVAQLERLRLQERWKKLVESDPSQAHNLHFQFPFPVVDPSAGFSFPRYGPANYAAFVAASEAQMRNRMGPVGFPAAGCDFLGAGGSFSDTSTVDRVRIAAAAAHDARLHMARELSSSQKVQCLSDQCEVCAKKKRIQGENSLFNGWNSTIPEAEMSGCDFLGLNLGRGRAVDGGSKGFGGKGERCGGTPGTHVREGVDVSAAFQRKGKSVGELKEYEFFPGKGSYSSNSSSSSSRGGVSASVSAADALAGEACSSTPSCSGFLDLSLKLSF